MNKILIQNPRIINEGRSFIGSVLVEGDKIAAVFEGEVPGNVRAEANQVIDATGKWLIPGVIDDQVHFRDPGLTHKGDIGDREPCGRGRWRDDLHGYAEHEATDHDDRRSGMEIQPCRRGLPCELLLLLRWDER